MMKNQPNLRRTPLRLLVWASTMAINHLITFYYENYRLDDASFKFHLLANRNGQQFHKHHPEPRRGVRQDLHHDNWRVHDALQKPRNVSVEHYDLYWEGLEYRFKSMFLWKIKTVFIIFELFVSILQFNMLIAMMVRNFISKRRWVLFSWKFNRKKNIQVLFFFLK